MGPPVSRTSNAGMLVAYWSLIVDQQLTQDLFSQQLLSNNEASKAFGGILAIPDLVGNLGLGCTVSFWTLARSPRMWLTLHATQPIGLSLGSQCKSTPVICSEV